MAKKRDQPPMPQPPTHGEDGDRLTTEDEKILDAVAARITPKQLAASKRFLARIAEAKTTQHQKKGKK